MKYLKSFKAFENKQGNINLSNFKIKLKTLQGLNIQEEVIGDFRCSNNELVDLLGAPKEVDGDFCCEHNILTTLKGSPIIVGGVFDCSNNNLTSLEYAPLIVKRTFWCGKNKLKNLDFLPSDITELYCYDNDWEKPIPYKIMTDFKLKCVDDGVSFLRWVYTQDQFDKFSSLEFQKDFLKKYPENFIDLKPFGYAKGIEELFPHLFDMDELGLID
jgi:hypothetical protein